MNVSCLTAGKMVVTMNLEAMPYVDANRTHLNNDTCKGTTSGTTLTIETGLSNCGNVASQNDTHVKYTNNVKSYVKDESPHITREYNMKLPFSCKFPRTDIYVHDGIQLDPLSDVTITEDSEYR